MQSSNYIRTNIQEEKSNFSHQVQNLKQVVGKFETAGFFEQLENLEKQNSDLQKTVENTLFKHFLLVLELERRAHAFDNLSIKYDQLLVKSDEERKQYIVTIQNNRKKLENEINSRLSTELDGLNQAHKNEIMKYEERIRDLQNQLTTKESQVNSLSDAISKKDTEKNQWANRSKELERIIEDIKHENQLTLSQLKVQHEDNIRQMQGAHKDQMNDIRGQFDQKYSQDMKNLKSELENNFNRQLGDKMNAISSLQKELGRCHEEIDVLNRDLDNVNQRFLVSNEDGEKLREQIEQIKASNTQNLMRLNSDFEEKLQNELYAKERGLGEKHRAELGQVERQLKAQKDIVLKLEKNEAYLINERDRLGRQLNDATKEMEEWRSKFQEIKVNSERHINQLTVEKTTIINNNLSEIERLKLEIQSLNKVHETEKGSLHQDIQELGQQIKAYSSELEKQRQIDAMRKKEIENWKNNYSHFVTADQVDEMKGEIKKLRAQKMELEDANLGIETNLKRVMKEKNALFSDVEGFKSHIESQNSLNERRKKELIEAQSHIDKLEGLLRGANKDKLNIDAEKMMTLEDHSRLVNELKNTKALAEQHRLNAEKAKQMLNQKTAELMAEIHSLQKFMKRDVSPDKFISQKIVESNVSVRQSGINLNQPGYYNEERQNMYH